MQDRRQVIIEELEKQGQVRVADLSAQLNCSEVTIRHDLQQLEQEGLLRRIHGGAVYQERKIEHHYAGRNVYRNVDRKKKIAASAYQFIEDGDTIILDDASTTFYLALYIKDHPEKHVVVVTNSLPIGNELAGLDYVETLMVGGYVGGDLPATLGNLAESDIEQYHVSKGFIGVHSLNFDVGLSSVGTPQMQIKQSILKAADHVYVLADSAKFSDSYLSVICPIQDVYKIITDDEISEENVKRAQETGVSLVIAHEESL